MGLPRNILEASERVLDYHRQTRLDQSETFSESNLAARPPEFHLFDYADKVSLSNRLLDAPTPLLMLMEQGLEAVPESLHLPPQNLQTLSSWLYLAAGPRGRVSIPGGTALQRTLAGNDGLLAVEVYVAVFSVQGIDPGFYHYSFAEHALRRLRDGEETLYLLRRGRPDLQFLGTVPAAVLVSTVFCRTSWLNGRRGYRQAILQAGQMTEALHLVAMGLGMRTVTRLRMTESSMRELLGLPLDVEYAHAESVQSMVVWADGATVLPQISSPKPPITVSPLPRPACEGVVAYGSILTLHEDITATGVAVREVRPPLTDLTPIPATVPMARLPITHDSPVPSSSCRGVMSQTPYRNAFQPRPVSRDLMVRLVRGIFRGGTYFPLKPDGSHTALVRPFWVMQNIVGQEPGIWWYDPVIDKWAHLNRGQYKQEIGAFIPNSNEILVSASAVCVLVANLRRLLMELGPDLYRLANLEAGIVGQRLALAVASVGLGCRVFDRFHDDAWKSFLGLGGTGWEPLLVCALGGSQQMPYSAGERPSTKAVAYSGELEFRD